MILCYDGLFPTLTNVVFKLKLDNSLFSILKRFTDGNADFKSINAAKVSPLRFVMELKIVCVKIMFAVWHERIFLKPCCWSISKVCESNSRLILNCKIFSNILAIKGIFAIGL